MTKKTDLEAPATKGDLALLRSEMNDRFGTIDARFETIDDRFQTMDDQFKLILDLFDRTVCELKQHMDQVAEKSAQQLYDRLAEQNASLHNHERRLAKVEHQLGIVA